MRRKVIPTGQILTLVKQLQKSAKESERTGFEFSMDGSYAIDKENQLGFSVAAEVDIPVEGVGVDVETSVKSAFDNQFFGSWKLRVWSDPGHMP